MSWFRRTSTPSDRQMLAGLLSLAPEIQSVAVKRRDLWFHDASWLNDHHREGNNVGYHRCELEYQIVIPEGTIWIVRSLTDGRRFAGWTTFLEWFQINGEHGYGFDNVPGEGFNEVFGALDAANVNSIVASLRG